LAADATGTDSGRSRATATALSAGGDTRRRFVNRGGAFGRPHSVENDYKFRTPAYALAAPVAGAAAGASAVVRRAISFGSRRTRCGVGRPASVLSRNVAGGCASVRQRIDYMDPERKAKRQSDRRLRECGFPPWRRFYLHQSHL